MNQTSTAARLPLNSSHPGQGGPASATTEWRPDWLRRSGSLLVLLLLLTLLTSCRLGRRAEPPPMPATIANRMAGGVTSGPLSLASVSRGEVVQQALYSGQVVLARQENLFFRRSGRVTQVYVNDGAQVQAGDLLAELDNSQLELDLEVALLSLEIAQQELRDAQTELTFRRRQAEFNLEIARLRLANLRATGETTDEEPATIRIQQIQVDLAELQLEQIDETVNPVLELNVQRAELAVRKVKESILDGQITAPFDGELRFINLPEADQQLAVQAYGAVARLVEPNSFQIELNLPRAQLEPLSEGMRVQVSSATLPGARLAGVIRALPRPFGTSQGSLTQVALVNAADRSRLNEGATVAVSVALRSKQNALVIPRLALRQENQNYYVFVKNGDLVERATVAVGILGNDTVEIVGGLTEGQQVVLSDAR
jgi:HlyD family secretion protein